MSDPHPSITAASADDNPFANGSLSAATPPWTKLTKAKQFSRILYPNPVCLLGTWSIASSVASSGSEAVDRNVLVISWLTAVNNEGRLVLSINSSRYSTGLLKQSGFFSLSVPVEGMEQLICDVGGLSGRFGSKFPEDMTPKTVKDNGDKARATRNKRRKRQLERLRAGIPGLERISMAPPEWSPSTPPGAFAIKDSVARLLCKVYSFNEGVLDEGHVLVVADVIEGIVRTDYWDADRNLFFPLSTDLPSYLTFLGSQQFGSVHSVRRSEASQLASCRH